MLKAHRISALFAAAGFAAIATFAFQPAPVLAKGESPQPKPLDERGLMPFSVVADADNAMGFKLLSELRKADGDKNVFISSLSIGVALQMTYNGARGDTAKEMLAAMQFHNPTLENVNKGNLALRERLTKNDKIALKIANAIWTNKGEDFDKTFLGRVRDNYGADVRSLDFGDPQTVEIINQWCADNTNNKITKIVGELNPHDQMILANAVYFKGNWKTQFKKDKTYDEKFTRTDGKQVDAPLMHGEFDISGFEGEGFTAGKLYYEDGNTCMQVFVPEKADGLGDLVAKLTPENWKDWQGKFRRQSEADIALPRFKVEYSTSLVDSFKQLGMKKAFGGGDFGGMRPDGATDLVIADILHKTFVDVNEEGTEAAAVTAVKMSNSARESFSLRADKPFFYAIVDEKTGTILFMGVMLDPTVK